MNWQERINDKLIGEQTEFKSRQEVEERIRNGKARLDDGYGFLLSLDLGIQQTLEEIRDHVWRGGEVGLFERSYSNRRVPRSPDGKRWGSGGFEGLATERGIALTYSYPSPLLDYEDVYEEKFGFYTEPYTTRWSSNTAHGEVTSGWGSADSSGEQLRFGRHQVKVGTKALLRQETRIQFFAVVIEHFRFNFIGRDEFTFSAKGHAPGVNGRYHPLDPAKLEGLDVSRLRILIEEALVEYCADRTKARLLPWQIEEDLQGKFEDIQKKVQEHQEYNI